MASGKFTLVPPTGNTTLKSSPTYWEQPGMPRAARLRPGSCRVLLKITAPTGEPVGMFEVTRLMLLPITGRAEALRASAVRSGLVRIGRLVLRLTVPGSRLPAPGLQPVRAVWLVTAQARHRISIMPEAKTATWKVFVLLVPVSGTLVKVTYAAWLGASTSNTTVPPVPGLRSVHRGQTRGPWD